MASLMIRGQDEPESLSEVEGVQFVFLIASYFNQFERLHRMFEAGALSADEWARWASIGAQILATPGGQKWRAESPGFSRLFDELDKHRTEGTVAPDRLRHGTQ